MILVWNVEFFFQFQSNKKLIIINHKYSYITFNKWTNTIMNLISSVFYRANLTYFLENPKIIYTNAWNFVHMILFFSHLRNLFVFLTFLKVVPIIFVFSLKFNFSFLFLLVQFSRKKYSKYTTGFMTLAFNLKIIRRALFYDAL
jgi:hypothetical protein